MSFLEVDVAPSVTGGEVCLEGALVEEAARSNARLAHGPYQPYLMAARELLLATLDESAAWYTEVTTDLNKDRSRDQQIEIVPESELADRASLWLNDDRFRAARNEKALHSTPNQPIVVMALPNVPITHEETVQTWANARGGKLKGWAGRMAFLQHWSADELSGFDPNQAEEPVRFVIIETAYNRERRGHRVNQLTALRKVQTKHPCVGVATLFEGGILSKRFAEELKHSGEYVTPTDFDFWQEAHVQAIDIKPNWADNVPYAFNDHRGRAVIDETQWGYCGVARYRIG